MMSSSFETHYKNKNVGSMKKSLSSESSFLMNLKKIKLKGTTSSFALHHVFFTFLLLHQDLSAMRGCGVGVFALTATPWSWAPLVEASSGPFLDHGGTTSTTTSSSTKKTRPRTSSSATSSSLEDGEEDGEASKSRSDTGIFTAGRSASSDCDTLVEEEGVVATSFGKAGTSSLETCEEHSPSWAPDSQQQELHTRYSSALAGSFLSRAWPPVLATLLNNPLLGSKPTAPASSFAPVNPIRASSFGMSASSRNPRYHVQLAGTAVPFLLGDSNVCRLTNKQLFPTCYAAILEEYQKAHVDQQNQRDKMSSSSDDCVSGQLQESDSNLVSQLQCMTLDGGKTGTDTRDEGESISSCSRRPLASWWAAGSSSWFPGRRPCFHNMDVDHTTTGASESKSVSASSSGAAECGLATFLAAYPNLEEYCDPNSYSGIARQRGPLSIPPHVGIVMDGNGRWAQQRSLHRSFGHKKAEDNVHKIIEAAAKIGVQQLTLFAFSSDNWARPKDEVSHLMQRFASFLVDSKLRKQLTEHQIQVRVIGDLSPPLPPWTAEDQKRVSCGTCRNIQTGVVQDEEQELEHQEDQEHLLSGAACASAPVVTGETPPSVSGITAVPRVPSMPQGLTQVYRTTSPDSVTTTSSYSLPVSERPQMTSESESCGYNQLRSRLQTPPAGGGPQVVVDKRKPQLVADTACSAALEGDLQDQQDDRMISSQNTDSSWLRLATPTPSIPTSPFTSFFAVGGGAFSSTNPLNLNTSPTAAASGASASAGEGGLARAIAGSSKRKGWKSLSPPVQNHYLKSSHQSSGCLVPTSTPTAGRGCGSIKTSAHNKKCGTPRVASSGRGMIAGSSRAFGGRTSSSGRNKKATNYLPGTNVTTGGTTSSRTTTRSKSLISSEEDFDQQGGEQGQTQEVPASSSPCAATENQMTSAQQGPFNMSSSEDLPVANSCSASRSNSPPGSGDESATSPGLKQVALDTTGTEIGGLQPEQQQQQGGGFVSSLKAGATGLLRRGQDLFSPASGADARRSTSTSGFEFTLLDPNEAEASEHITASSTKKKGLQLDTASRERFQQLIADLQNETKDHKGMRLNILLSYSSSWEIQQGVERYVKFCADYGGFESVAGDEMAEQLPWCDNLVRMMHVDSDVDLLVRTGNAARLSEFCLTQLRYAELYLESKFFPDYTPDDLLSAIRSYSGRQRRRGKTPEQAAAELAQQRGQPVECS
ncbi:unnamed protein product [Amoebophrya sp. A25]|nr:unnamed protein product [Amoebophrya sp. A25]|eukprot:GSA25T00003046001.1